MSGVRWSSGRRMKNKSTSFFLMVPCHSRSRALINRCSAWSSIFCPSRAWTWRWTQRLGKTTRKTRQILVKSRFVLNLEMERATFTSKYWPSKSQWNVRRTTHWRFWVCLWTGKARSGFYSMHKANSHRTLPPVWLKTSNEAQGFGGHDPAVQSEKHLLIKDGPEKRR